MKLRLTALISCALMLCPLIAATDDLLLPLVAFDLHGKDGNRWSSELYITNTGSEDVVVSFGSFLSGTRIPPDICEIHFGKEIPAGSTMMWWAEELGTALGCIDHAVGAITLTTTGPVEVGSRIVNHTGPPPSYLLSGFGQWIEAASITEIPETSRVVLPGLLWHRNACGLPQFETYFGVANPSDEPITVTLDRFPGENPWDPGFHFGGQKVPLPHTFEVPANSWRHIHVAPLESMLTVCMGPELFGLTVDIAGRGVVYASVVDRSTQDPRTVKAIPLN